MQKELLGEKQFISFITYLKRNKVYLWLFDYGTKPQNQML
jgi:hypothetical protein